MGILVDIIVLGILALSIFIGYKRGLIKCAINILSFFIAIIVVIILTIPISNFVINNTQIDDNIKNSIASNLHIESNERAELDEENSNTPEVVRNYINDNILNSTKEATNNVTETVAENITNIIIKVGVAIILYFITRFALIFVKVLANIVDKIPLIKQFNRAGGLIYGIISGIVILYLIFAIISLIAPMLANSAIIDAINKSFIGSYVYNNNLLLKFFL